MIYTENIVSPSRIIIIIFIEFTKVKAGYLSKTSYWLTSSEASQALSVIKKQMNFLESS